MAFRYFQDTIKNSLFKFFRDFQNFNLMKKTYVIHNIMLHVYGSRVW